jgi:SOS response regulatory protein OraA/RecX
LRLTQATIDGKAAEAKTYLDIIDRLAKMAWLDDLGPQERAAQRLADRRAATDAMNAYIGQWLAENPMEGEM